MINFAISSVGYLVLAWFACKVTEIIVNVFFYRNLRKCGVKFAGGDNYSMIRNLKAMKNMLVNYPTCISYQRLLLEYFKPHEMPPIVGLNLMGRIVPVVTSVELLPDLYVNKNAAATKHFINR